MTGSHAPPRRVDPRDDIFVGGAFAPARSPLRLDVVNPATEAVIGGVPDAGPEDLDAAVGAARSALVHPAWAALSPSDRAGFLLRLADALEARKDELGQVVTTQNGMPISMSVPANGVTPARVYRYYARLIADRESEERRVFEGATTIVRSEPVGVVGLITAWNGPQALAAFKLAPALAAGCTAVVKPAPETSLDAYILAEAILDAGLPDGVVNIVTGGAELGSALVAHRGIDKIAFTGSTAVGKRIAILCGEDLKPVTLELGGKSAAIVLDDAPLDLLQALVPRVCSPNTGQVCYSASRILAPRRRYAEVVDTVAGAMSEARLGDPMDPLTVFGPLASTRQRQRVESYIEGARAAGAATVVGGGRPRGIDIGYFVEPTVFSDVNNSMRVAREEIFGPVLVVIPYDGVADAIEIANDSPYGLGGCVITADLDRGLDVARQIETGTIGVNHYAMDLNAPFGGCKESGLGRELGPEGLLPYLRSKSIYLPPAGHAVTNPQERKVTAKW